MRCQGIALYFEYLCLLSRCCASLCKAAFPRGLMTGPLMQKTQVVFPTLSIQHSPLRPCHTRAHLGWLAWKLFGARPIPLCALTERSTQWSPSVCLLPPCRGWQGRLRRRGNMPRRRQAVSTLNALPENQLLAARFCTVPGRVFLCNSSGLKLSRTPWPSCPLRHGDADLECGE